MRKVLPETSEKRIVKKFFWLPTALYNWNTGKTELVWLTRVNVCQKYSYNMHRDTCSWETLYIVENCITLEEFITLEQKKRCLIAVPPSDE